MKNKKYQVTTPINDIEQKGSLSLLKKESLTTNMNVTHLKTIHPLATLPSTIETTKRRNNK